MRMDARETHGKDQSSSTLLEKIKNQFECVPTWPEVQLCKTKSKVGDVLLFDCQRTAGQCATVVTSRSNRPTPATRSSFLFGR